jgi:ABC-type dipeptide/oligopeptide/nickel transport system permease subunit
MPTFPSKSIIAAIRTNRDTRWIIAWFLGILVLCTWDFFILNKPAFFQVITGFTHTIFIAISAVCLTAILSWSTANGLHMLRYKKHAAGYQLAMFCINMIRSIPQIVGVLFGYMAAAAMANAGIASGYTLMFFLAFIMSICMFYEVSELMRDRIDHFSSTDFFNAMQVCGIKEFRIVNIHVLWNNSRMHIYNKLISVFGMAVFLQCSVDFIVSVGLSSSVNSVSLPVTLGSLLAKTDSKQDILAIGYTLTHPAYFPNLLFGHLQGITVAFLIVYTLVCIYNIANGYAERHQL